MSLVKYEYPRSGDELDALWNRFFTQAFENWGLPTLASLGERGYRVRADLFDDNENYYVRAELPGIPKEAIHLELHNNVLTIEGEQKREEGKEVYKTAFNRSLTLMEDVDAEKVTAKLENGLLTVTLPKQEKHKPKAIMIA